MKTGVSIFFALILLAACNAGNAPTATIPPRVNTRINTPKPVGTNAMPTLVAATEDASTQSIDCGDVTVSGSPARAADVMSAQAAAACFMSALNVCQPAALTFRESATGAIRQFSITGTRRNCLIRQALQPDASSAPAVVDCVSAEIQDEQLVIRGCSHLGDFILGLGN